MNILRTVFSNGFMLLVPVFIWNILFTRKLPLPYGSPEFDSAVPRMLLVLETVFRGLVFTLPLALSFDISPGRYRFGFYAYLAGILVYFASWLPLILIPGSAWSRSLIGFTAPAYAPLIWLAGMALMFRSWYFATGYASWQYLVPAGLFTVFHFAHTALSFTRLLK